MSRKTKEQIEKDKLEKNTRLQLTDWLYSQYDVSFLPKHFFINLNKVYSGTYKNLNKPVPVEDLFEMWKRKMPYLRKVYEKNKRCGKKMEGVARINYDLAIILTKYDSFLKWKEEQKLLQIQSSQKEMDINYNNIRTKIKGNTSDKTINNNDITDILNEI